MYHNCHSNRHLESIKDALMKTSYSLMTAVRTPGYNGWISTIQKHVLSLHNSELKFLSPTIWGNLHEPSSTFHCLAFCISSHEQFCYMNDISFHKLSCPIIYHVRVPYIINVFKYMSQFVRYKYLGKKELSIPSATPFWTLATHYMFAAVSRCCYSFQLTHVHAPPVASKKN